VGGLAEDDKAGAYSYWKIRPLHFRIELKKLVFIVVGFIASLVSHHGIALAGNDTTAIKRVTVSGRVLDADTGEPMEFIGVRHGKRGKYTNRDGEFELRVPEGKVQLVFSMVGLKESTLILDLERDTSGIEVFMEVAELDVEDLIVYAENLAKRTVRRLVNYRDNARDSLDDYQYMLYTKLIVTTDTLTAGRTDRAADTTVFSILESYSEGYYQKPDEYFNNIIQKRQSLNIPPQANFVNFGANINLFDQEVTILGERIRTPFSIDALEYYDFEMLGKQRINDSTRLHKIKCTPKNDNRRLFSGTLYIDSIRNHLHSASFKPNIAVRLPFDAYLEIDQYFENYDGFNLPTGMRLYSTLDASIFWIVEPRFDIRIETVAYDYDINVGLDDDMFSGRRLDLDKRARDFEPEFWRDNNVLPLREMEEEAYEQIRRTLESPDSVEGTSFLDKALGPVANVLRRLNRPPYTGFQDIFRYNRVQGVSLGIGLGGELGDQIDYYVNGGYGFADKRPYFSGETSFFTDDTKTFGLDLRGNLGFRRRDDPFVVKWRSITPLALLTGRDYGDYYYSDSYYAGLNLGFGQDLFVGRQKFRKPWLFKLGFQDEYSRSADVNTDFSFFGADTMRRNHSVGGGNIRSMIFEANMNYTRLRQITDIGFHYKLEAAGNVLGGDYSFLQHYIETNLYFPTAPLWTANIKLSAGTATGNLPAERFYSLETGIARIVTAGAFRNMGIKEFYGDRFIAINFEHNFGEIVPGIFRIPNIASFGLEFLLLANAAYTEFSPAAQFNDGNAYLSELTTAATVDNSYYELGIGINRLFLFFRFDIMARFSQVDRPRILINLGSASFR
jgi:hypothetical protein